MMVSFELLQLFLFQSEWHLSVRVESKFPVLHRLKFDVDDLNDTVKDHVIVELKLLVEIVLLLELLELLCSIQQIV